MHRKVPEDRRGHHPGHCKIVEFTTHRAIDPGHVGCFLGAANLPHLGSMRHFVQSLQSRLPDRARAMLHLHGPGITAEGLVYGMATAIGAWMPIALVVALLVAAIGSGALVGGLGPAVSAGGVALPAWWLLGLPFDLFLFGAFVLGVLLLGVAGESLQRSRRHAGDLEAELAATQRRLAQEADTRHRAEQAEAALRHAQERFERLVESVVPVVVTDADGRCLEANPAFLELAGYQAEDLAGGGIRWESFAVPAERALDERAVHEAQMHGAAPPYERMLVRRDGRRVPVLVGALAIAPGESALLWFAIDLGAREQLAEEQAARTLLDVIFETAPVGLGLYDHHLRFVRVNRRLAEIHGLPPSAQVGRLISDVLPDIGPAMRESLARVFRTGDPVEHVEVRGRTPASPAERYWDVSFYPVGIPDDPFFTVASIVYEVTDRRRAEAEREALLQATESARAEAELASRAKDEFLAVLSHELRAPLQGVLGWVSLLRDGRLDAGEHARARQAIERSTRLQTQLITDLLDVSRIISGKMTLDSRPLDVTTAVREAVEQLRPSAESRGITLETSIVDCGIMLGDSERVQQVLGNLLSNAVKFTPAGGTITLRCARGGHEVVIEVADTGEGIAAEFIPFVFDRFRQADSSSSRRHGGLGIGLAITRRLVELHGGSISVHSDGLGRGARFTVRLPLHDFAVNHHLPTPSGTGRALRGRRILVVEDDADSREAVTLALTLEGAHVRAAGSVNQALERIDGFDLDAIVSDLSMPGADGCALLAGLRARGVAAPAIAVSGFATLEDRRRAAEAGFCAHVAKPVEITALLRTLADVF